MYTCLCPHVAECFLLRRLIFRDIYKNKIGVRAIRAAKYKKVWRENLLTIRVKVHKSNSRVKRWHSKCELLKTLKDTTFGKTICVSSLIVLQYRLIK